MDAAFEREGGASRCCCARSWRDASPRRCRRLTWRRRASSRAASSAHRSALARLAERALGAA